MGCLICKSFTQVVPFSCMIKGGLQNGMSITVCGRVLPNADRWVIVCFVCALSCQLNWYWLIYGWNLKSVKIKLIFSILYSCFSPPFYFIFNRFNVNLQQGSETVALHVNPRYASWLGPGYVVHNTRQYGKWGWEERKVETPFPKGQTFSLQILVTQASYKVTSTLLDFFSSTAIKRPFFILF